MNTYSYRKILVGLLALLLLSALPAAAHMPVPLLDAEGNRIEISVPGTPSPAFSMKQTCQSCHDYNAIEQHSFHAQTGANEFFGWAHHNPDSQDKFVSGPVPEGKNWLQTPGHFGNWDPPSVRQLAQMFEGVPGTGNYDAASGQFLEAESNSWLPKVYADLTEFRNKVDMSVPGNIMDCGECHVGGGAMEYVPNTNLFARVPLRDIAKPTREAIVLDADGNPVLEPKGFRMEPVQETVVNDVNGLGGPIDAATVTAFNYFIDIYDVDGDSDKSEVQYIDYANTGVLEVDCFVCHLKDYNYAARKAALRKGKLDASRSIAAGIASDNGLQWPDGGSAPAGYGTTVIYGDNLVGLDFINETGPVLSQAFFDQRLNRTPLTNNCALCHFNEFAVDWKKRGDNWQGDFRHTFHTNFGCLGCHQRSDGVSLDGWDMQISANYPKMGEGTMGHDPAKGDVPFSEVFNASDDAAFKDCESCHLRGGDGGQAYGAPDPTAAHDRAGLMAEVVQDPLKMQGVPEISHVALMDCTVCHVRKISSASWNTGGSMVDATGNDAAGHLFDYTNDWVDRNNMTDRSSLSWYLGRLQRNNVVTTMFWRDGNDADFDVNFDGNPAGLDPLLPTQILSVNLSNDWTSLTADNNGQVTAAKINERVSNLNSFVAGWVGSGTPDTRFSLASVPFKVNHNVSPVADSFGIGGCADCHSETAEFYNGGINPLGDGSSLYWDDDRVPYVMVNGQTQASDFDPKLRDKSAARSIAIEFANVATQIDSDNNGTPEDYFTVRPIERSEMIYEDDFKAPAAFAASYSSAAAIDFSGNEQGWLLKVEASNDGGQTVVNRSRLVATDVGSVAELLTDLGSFVGDFEFVVTANGTGGITISGQNGYQVRLHAQAWAGKLQMETAAWRDVQWFGTNGTSYDGRADWVAYLNTLGDPAVTGIGIDPISQMLPINSNQDIEVGSTITLSADTSVNTAGTFSYSWIVSDTAGEVLEGESVQKTFDKIGTWLVTLRVVDEEGKLAQSSLPVTVVAPAPDTYITYADNGVGVPAQVTFNNMPESTMLYVIWGDGTKDRFYENLPAGSNKTVDHLFRQYAKYDKGDYFEYRMTVYVYNGSTRVEVEQQTVRIMK
ncbi:hypothetical protein SAMN02745165_00805 [Malonomonas rubra DSM 5091]|uniref:PKD domain-containing protein n=1 Tax=Malonomonas rubra DSM 5091 TaxID=1122189 RepID=A0A1M6DTV9_MALRU|nr:PKD domain-containing protein [Malonomonas rubra]SHI76686.1 hypothetical protein SAMN02745165_00805 [Malonomonas rubra DSM 5091]